MKSAVVAIGLLLVAAALAWNAGEEHYRNCIEAATAIPDVRRKIEREVEEFKGKNSHAERIHRRVKQCSRTPW